MHGLDWALFVGFLAYVVIDGVRRTRRVDGAGSLLAGRSAPWWAVGISVMATQASAITMIATTGHGWADGVRFVQFYFALPLAMVILAFTLVPRLHRSGVATAYAYLGRRFGRSTHLVSAFVFLVLRALSAGFVIYTPALVLSVVFGWPLDWTIVGLGVVATAYTAIGGLAAVIRTDVKQAAVMALGLAVAIAVIVGELGDSVGLRGAWAIASELGRLDAVDWSFDPADRYTVWSALLGGTLLFLAYFGADQSQVQRLLAARSVRDARGALLLNAVAKVPFQFALLGCGVLLFVLHAVDGAPIGFAPTGPGGAVSPETERRYADASTDLATAARRVAGGDAAAADALRDANARWRAARTRATVERRADDDTRYVFVRFVLEGLPIGLVGLLLAGIVAAALSSLDSEINALATVAATDVPRAPPPGADDVLVRRTRVTAVVAGAFATGAALWLDRGHSLIEQVNAVGSLFYGSLLGAFVLTAIRRVGDRGATVGILAGVAASVVASRADVPFLYLNTIGVATTVLVGTTTSWIGSMLVRDGR